MLRRKFKGYEIIPHLIAHLLVLSTPVAVEDLDDLNLPCVNLLR
jgi:hypothetical protein